MHMRPYTSTDISAIADIVATCNRTDALVRSFTNDIERYPTSYRRGVYRFLKNQVLGPGTVSFVVETNSEDYAYKEQRRNPEVVGLAVWTRHGSTDQAKQWQCRNSGWKEAIERYIMSWDVKYNQLFPSVEPTFNHAAFQQVLPLIREPWDPEIFGESWELNSFFVHPDWQRRGLGKRMLQWGFERATEENVPIVVSGSALGAAAYRAAGFRSLKIADFSPFFVAREYGGEDYQKWVWEPQFSKGSANWFNRAEAKLREADTANVQGSIESQL